MQPKVSGPKDKSGHTPTSHTPAAGRTSSLTMPTALPAQAGGTKPKGPSQAEPHSEEEGGKGGGGKKKKKNKMQKVNPSDMLGFTVNAPDRPNLGGEMHSVRDAM